jgi:hypothetical protein
MASEVMNCYLYLGLMLRDHVIYASTMECSRDHSAAPVLIPPTYQLAPPPQTAPFANVFDRLEASGFVERFFTA